MLRALPELGKIDGRAVMQARLCDGELSVTILSLGCITQDWRVAGAPVVLGFADPAQYIENKYYFGAVVGRVANRIAGGRFLLNGRVVLLDQNEGTTHLHGGAHGLSTRNWAMEADRDNAVRLSYTSPDGEEGYPGAIEFTVTIRLRGHTLSYQMTGMPDRATPINLAQHNYYALGGPIWEQRLHIAARSFTPTDAHGIPTGEIAPVAGTRFDFNTPHQMPPGETIDMNLVLEPGAAPEIQAPNGRHLRMRTDQPGVQLYNAAHLHRVAGGHNGQVYDHFDAICLEPQHFPDALNHSGFAPIICTPEHPYRQALHVEISKDAARC